MNSRSKSGTKGSFSVAQNKSVVLKSSSEENILPIHGGPLQAAHIESGNTPGGGPDAGKGIKKEVSVQVKYGEEDGITPPPSTWGNS